VDVPTFDDLLKTVAPTVAKRNETWEEQSVPISVVWPREVILKTSAFFLDV
jgi:hypothetical protein